jgi:hypothetical protein
VCVCVLGGYFVYKRKDDDRQPRLTVIGQNSVSLASIHEY